MIERRNMFCIRKGNIHDAVHKEAYVADILVDGGIIKEIGVNITVPDGTGIINAEGKEVYPGFVEAHSHIGLRCYGASSGEHNEVNDICSPQLRAIDGVNPMDPAFEKARNAGVTCVCTGPGSANVLGGTFTAMKTVGKRVDNMIVKKEIAMKCAFGENPQNTYRSKRDSSKMTTAAILREALWKAKRYQQKIEAAGNDKTKYPEIDIKMEALLPVMRGEMPLKAHVHQTEDIFTAIRIAEEFGVRITLDHVTQGHFVAEELAQTDLYVAVGPTLNYPSKVEVRNKDWAAPGILSRAGCHVSIITDNPVMRQELLPLCAGFAIKAGMDPFDALRAITICPAEHTGIEERVGSLEVGKDADIVIANGCPFEIATQIEMVFINGEVVNGIHSAN